ncbi:zinc finger CCCH domain-containing protein 32 isoform X2 [Vigna radiata var. radiata]|uniref:Zinc finger CCCH domain-containing protein 32 isoform X2 n=1 Tax=Vigna radiata var. radiata TaxID=3916 RepID=A0A3Q0F8T7_VIGRR|nr:zinc finger CCCH domain-containing protein 32 isoform X2 [Vigna radiata var. radiata]
MDLYGRAPVRNGSNPVNQPEWPSPGIDTALEESMWHLTLGGGESYPERPGVPNCVYYMRTGVCGYGSRCRYNHPRDRAAYYLKTGTCKFGASCKFHHPKNGGGYLSQAPLNTYGYPLRPGEKECSYYLKTGQCKFGVTCKFHHPQPAGSPLPASAPQFYQQVQSPTVPVPEQYAGASANLRVARPPVLSGSYVQGAYGPVLLSPGVVQFPGWSPYSAPVSPVLSPGAQPAVGATSLYGVTQLSSPTSAFARPYTPLSSTTGPSGNIPKDQLFPERPGEPECQYFLRTGDCKFGLACRYHHPRDHIVARPFLSPIGLPLRPGEQPCAFYLQNGHCKFGSTCKFDHPLGSLNYSPSVSSFIDVPVTPYPVGSLLSQLAPSTTSSELRPELISGSKKESLSARIPSSGTSVGLIFSQGGSISLSDVQLSSQSSAPLGSSRSNRQSGEIR